MRWTKNGAELFDGGSLDLHQSAEVCVLHIINVRRSDAAEYEMELSNDSGTETVPITVKVIGKCNCFTTHSTNSIDFIETMNSVPLNNCASVL